MKKVWVTALNPDQEKVQAVLGAIKQYGLDGNGHFWTDDLKNMAWMGPKEQLDDRETALWVLLGSLEDIKENSVGFGLSMLTLAVQAQRGFGFPILLIDTKGDIDVEKLPTPLKGADCIGIDSPSLGAKMVAKANTPVPEVDTEYRINVHANTGYGLWIETGPSGSGVWKGAMAGVCGEGEIDFHGTGAAGVLPEKATLEYPVKGLKLQLGEKEFTAWAVQNELDAGSSYFVRIKDMPQSIVFGPYDTGEEASVHVIDLY